MKTGQPKLSESQKGGLFVTATYLRVGQVIGTEDLQLHLNPDL
jgi:hypothetical protein